MKPPLRVQIVGGLGNQLHGLSAGLAIAGTLKRQLIVDTSRVSFGSNLTRMPELRGLELSEKAIEHSFYEVHYPKIELIFEKFRRHSRGLIKPRLTFDEPNYWDNFDDPNMQILKIDENKSSVGGPFMDFAWASRALEFGFPRDCNPIAQSKKYKSELSKIKEKDVAIHIRIGDYLKLQEIFPIVRENYYFEALNCIQNLEDSEIVIFTDSPKLLNKLYPSLLKIKNLRIARNDLTPLETMSLMSKYQRLIATNSTFSSWAGWFTEKQIVVTPTPHHKNGWRDYLPKEWIRIPLDID